MYVKAVIHAFGSSNLNLVIESVTLQQVAKMPRKSPPIVDALQKSHEIMRLKLDSYREVRPGYQFISMRNKRHEFIHEDSALHNDCLQEAFDEIIKKSEACKRVAGVEILTIVRDVLLDHAKISRLEGWHSHVQYHFTNIKEKQDLHPDSCYKRKIKHQKSYMQTVAAELEVQALMIFLEKKNIKEKRITVDEKLQTTHRLFKISPQAEQALNDLRMILLS